MRNLPDGWVLSRVLHTAAIGGLLLLLGAGQAGAVPPPGPLEVRLDRAKAVALGEVVRAEDSISTDGRRWTRTTLSVKEMLKGEPVDAWKGEVKAPPVEMVLTNPGDR